MNNMSELSNPDLQTIEEIHTHWISEELAGNSVEIVELCTNDVVWVPPNAPALVGKEAIKQYLNDNSGELKDIQIRDVVIRGNESVAYLTSNYWSRYVAEGTSGMQEATGSHLWVLSKTAGVWQVAVVAWSLYTNE
jgi:ketosteroid isomerase-like protein